MAEPTRPAKFFRITVGLFVLLLLAGVAIVLVVAFNAAGINRDGGWGFLLAMFVFVVIMTGVCAATAVTSALSLWKREAHRRFSIVVLIVSSLVVVSFGTGVVRSIWSQWQQSQEPARTRNEPRVFGDGGTEIPDSLVEHFRQHGFTVTPAVDRSSNRDYVLDAADVGPRCEVLVSFRGFASGTPIESIKKRLMEFNAASVLNEQAALAMFHPSARGKTGDKNDCEAWAAESEEIVEPLLDAFRSYRP